MKIDHIAIWVKDLETVKQFYVQYFNAIPNEKYTNALKQFNSYFLQFGDGCRLEIMHRPNIQATGSSYEQPSYGLAHFAFSTGSRANVDSLTERLRADGYAIVGNPRVTGDGFYESIALDPEGNVVEITE